MCFSAEIDSNLQSLAKRFQAQIDEKAYDKFHKLQAKFPKDFKTPGPDQRIYPNYFAPVIINEGGELWIRPMRYRIRPHQSAEEIPSKYNVFNARLDSLETKATWKNLFMKQHGLFPFRSFYEWVEDAQKKKVLLNFRPKGRDLMWAPCLWDHWQDPQSDKEFLSFALITTDPPSEISQMGHDRCPIFLEQSQIAHWLLPQKHSRKDIQHLLEQKESASFICQLAA